MKGIHIIINLFIYIFCIYFFKYYTNTFENTMQKICIISIIILLVNIFFYIKEYKYSFPVIGMNLSMACFFLGQCYLYILGIKNENLHIFYFSDNNNIILDAYIYSLEFITSFNIGIVLFDIFKKINYNNLKRETKIKKFTKLLEKLIKIWIVINIFVLYQIIKVFLIGNYEKIPEIKYLELILKELQYFINIYILFLCLNKNSVWNKYYKIIFFIFAGALFFLGSRTMAIGAFFLFFLLYENIIENKKIKLKQVIIFLFILAMIPVFALIRIGEKFDYKMILQIPVLLLKELGFSVVPTIVIIKNIPEKLNYEYGKVFLDSLFRVFRIEKIFPYKVSEYGSEIVTKLEQTDWGLGFSLVAEAYLNFGSYIIIFGILVGIIYSRFLIIKNEDGLLKKYIVIISTQILYFSVRSDFCYTILQIFYYIILLEIILKIVLISKLKSY